MDRKLALYILTDMHRMPLGIRLLSRILALWAFIYIFISTVWRGSCAESTKKRVLIKLYVSLARKARTYQTSLGAERADALWYLLVDRLHSELLRYNLT